MLDLAARIALRAAGDVEPNPLVGAVLVRSGRVIGLGHHRRFGGPHAEREALDDCRRRGHDPRGATLYVTLEPCRHHGKTPPCTDAIIEAGIARVVAARRDPGEHSGDGAAVLGAAGIPVTFTDQSPLACEVARPFENTVAGRPWVIAKWAQTRDGETRHGPDGSRWISGPVARRRVHRLRARMDAIVTGIGTVLADDPLLTARNVPRVRRVATRVVVDRQLRTSPESALIRTAREVPVLIAHGPGAERRRVEGLSRTGVEVVAVPERGAGIDLRALLAMLAQRGATNVLLEAGARLTAGFLEEGLVDEAIVYVAGPGAPAGRHPEGRLGELLRAPVALTLRRARTRGADEELTFRRPPS